MTVTIYQGDNRKVLRGLPAESVHCVVLSPPFWGLRDYGLSPLVWGGNRSCQHAWGDGVVRHRSSGGPQVPQTKWQKNEGLAKAQRDTSSNFCQLCGAWRGSLGLEPTPDLYVAHLVEVFREIKRVLRKDGTVWLNLGSSYAGSGAGSGGNREGNEHGQNDIMAKIGRPKVPTNFKPKDLIPIPWLVALALQADGWYLRSDIIWAKGVSGQKEAEAQIIAAIHESFAPKMAEFVESKLIPNLDLWVGGCMPSSVRDRPTTSHEYVFLLSKAKRYYYDKWAIVEPAKDWGKRDRSEGKYTSGKPPITGGAQHGLTDANHAATDRNRRTVWQINTRGFKGAHFAVFPPDLIRPMILAGTSERGCCKECGAPWKRITKRIDQGWDGSRYGKRVMDASGGVFDVSIDKSTLGSCGGRGTGKYETHDWHPTCKCNCPDTVPAIVLDPFFGSGTTGLVADELGRDCVGIDLSAEYVEMAANRIGDNVIIKTGEEA